MDFGAFEGTAGPADAIRYLNGRWWAGVPDLAVRQDVRAVGMVGATGPPASSDASDRGLAPALNSTQTAFAVRPADDEPLALFWNASHKDDEFARLLAGS